MQEITNPFGITVFGSSTIHVEPDFVSLNLSVSHITEKPQDAFREVHLATQKVRKFFSKAQVHDVASSRITLVQTFRYVNGDNKFVGYTAKMEFNVILTALDRLEEVILGAMENGVNGIGGTEFQTSRLKEFRAKARENAITAAQEKAENYCRVAGVKLGAVIHVEDVNPDIVRGRESHGYVTQSQVDDEGPIGAFNPSAILVAGAVRIAFQFDNQ